MKLILSCEHASNAVPSNHRHCFSGAESILASHRGWDPGALVMSQYMAEATGAPLFATHATRLLVEPNRSLDSRQLFSEFTSALPEETKQQILHEYYHPHRNAVTQWIAEQTHQQQTVLHISVHSFTDQLDGEVRDADVGLLFDPDRANEASFCAAWGVQLSAAPSPLPESRLLRVAHNYPYLGTDDGLTTWLRQRFTDQQYLGIELEVNQCHLKVAEVWENVSKLIAGIDLGC